MTDAAVSGAAGEAGYTLPETFASLAIAAIIAAVVSGAAGMSIRAETAAAHEILDGIAYIHFDRTLRETAGKVVIPYWESGLTGTGPAGSGAVERAEIPWYRGKRDSRLVLYIDGSRRLYAEETNASGDGGAPVLLSGPEHIRVDYFEIVTDPGTAPPGIRVVWTAGGRTRSSRAFFGGFPQFGQGGEYANN
jgi:type II secretory pathway pseudopilin PulG